MKRSPLRRTQMARGKVRVGARARARVRAGGVLAKGRQSLTLAGWRDLVARLTLRAGRRCEVPWCRRAGRLDPHHVVKRSAGGGDDERNLVMICRDHHQATDLPADHTNRLEVARTFAPCDVARERPTGFSFWEPNKNPRMDQDLVLWPHGE